MYACYYLIFMFKFVNCLVNCGVVLLLCVDGWVDHWCTDVSLRWRIPVVPTTPPPYYTTTTTYATTSSCTEVFKYYTTKAPEFYTTTTLPQATTLMPWSITLPRVTTPPRRRSTTWQRMLPHPTTPRLPSITLFSATYCIHTPNYFSVLSCFTEPPAYYSTKTVEYYTEVARYFSAPIYSTRAEAAKYYASWLATQKLLFRATLNWNTTLMLQSTTLHGLPYT
jgi:hypothetical protein